MYKSFLQNLVYLFAIWICIRLNKNSKNFRGFQRSQRGLKIASFGPSSLELTCSHRDSYIWLADRWIPIVPLQWTKSQAVQTWVGCRVEMSHFVLHRRLVLCFSLIWLVCMISDTGELWRQSSRTWIAVQLWHIFAQTCILQNETIVSITIALKDGLLYVQMWLSGPNALFNMISSKTRATYHGAHILIQARTSCCQIVALDRIQVLGHTIWASVHP